MWVSDVSSLSLGPPARPSKGIFARLEPAQSPKTRGSHITNKNSYNFRYLYVHKYPPARPSEANFTLPEPAQSPKSQKKAGSSPPEARKLEARTSLEGRHFRRPTMVPRYTFFFHQIPTFIKVRVAFVFGLQTLSFNQSV